MSRAESPWLAVHFHYHQNLPLLLRLLVAPLVRNFLAGAADRFFFVHYALGGPHIRLRLRVSSPVVDPDELLSRIGREADRFFSRHPSLRSWTAEEIRRRNRIILAQDPAERDEAIYPDNSFRSVPFHPEVERYGGPDLLPLSLDLFALSSVVALETLEAERTESRPVQLGCFFRLLAGQAQGLASDERELMAVLGRLSAPPGEAFGGVVEKADQAFRERREVFVRLFTEGVAGDRRSRLLCEGAARLRQGLGSASPATRERIAVSQIHMTANRLGLRLAEEIYLGRLLSLAAAEATHWRPAVWDSGVSETSLPDLAATALQRFAKDFQAETMETAPC